MGLVVLYLATAAIFLVADAVMLRLVIQPLFARHLGPDLRERIRLLPAALFYLAYIAVLLWFVSWPALQTGAPYPVVLLSGALLGFLAYGTYEFTSYAVMARWRWTMLASDLAWGTGLTAGSAAGGLAIARAVT